MDVTSPESIAKAIENIDKVNILINNAAKDPKVKKVSGLTTETRFENMTSDFWKEGIDAALNGTFFCSQAISKIMLKNGKGVILNISSDLGVIAPDQRIYRKEGIPDNEQNVKPITYSAAKWAVIGMTKYLATYWAGSNIRCNALSPGGVINGQDPEFVAKLSNEIPLGRMASKNEYRSAIQFLVSEASSYLNGHNLVIDGGRSIW